ncbi:FMN-binding protein [bacterium]|nr:FMN-binding protein [bacterium]
MKFFLISLFLTSSMFFSLAFDSPDKKMSKGILPYYICKEDNKVLGFIFDTKDICPDIKGYGGLVNFSVTIDDKGNILDIKLKEHKETPEYMDKIISAVWIEKFKNKNAKKMEFNKDIIAVTGATVSSEKIFETIKTSVNRVLDDFRGKGFEKAETVKYKGVAVREARFYVTKDEGRRTKDEKSF